MESKDLTTSKPKVEKVDAPVEVKGIKRVFLILVALFCGFWIIFPEPTDLYPILGWLDEATAGVILLSVLSYLGIRIPLLDRFLKKKHKG